MALLDRASAFARACWLKNSQRQFPSRKRQGGFILNPFRFGAAGGAGGNINATARMKAITIAGATGAGTGYQMLFKIGESATATGADFSIGSTATFPSASSSASSLGDIGFVAADLVTALPAWVEQVSGTTPNRVAWVWVKVAADLGSNQNIYCIYNNGTAFQTANGNSVFELFDDFNTPTLDTNKWKYFQGSGQLSFSTGIATLTGTGSSFTNLESVASIADGRETITNKSPSNTTQGTCGETGFTSLRFDNDWDSGGNGSVSEVHWETTAGAITRVALDAKYANSFYRIRTRRSGGVGSVLINDVVKMSVAANLDTAAKPIWLGGVYDAGALDKVDWIGVKKYQVTEPAFSSAGNETTYSGTSTTDPALNDTVTLIHGSGTNGSTALTDTALNPRIYKAIGGAQLSTAQLHYGSAAMYFAAAGDRFTTGGTSPFMFGAADYTVEALIYLTALPAAGNTAQIVGLQRWGTDRLWALAVDSNGHLSFNNQGAQTLVGTATLSVGQWYSVAITRAGTTLRTFVGGTLGATGTDSANYTAYSYPFTIGGDSTGAAGAQFQGYIQEVRITRGLARYTDTYVPATGAFADASTVTAINAYTVWNPADKGSGVTLSNGNLNGSGQISNGTARACLGKSTGKWYWEIKVPSLGSSSYGPVIGIATAQATLANYCGVDAYGWGWSPFETGGPGAYTNGLKTAYGTGIAAGDVFGVALDIDAGSITLYRNGVSMGVMYSNLPANTVFYPCCSGDASTTTVFNANFGATAFAYTPPAGYNPGFYEVAAAITKPTDLGGCALWLDGDDLTTLTVDGSNNISSWRDKSATALNFTQAVTANMPTRNTSVFPGGKGFVDCGVSALKWLTSAVSLAMPATGCTVFWVIYWAARNATYSALAIQNGTGSTSIQTGTGGFPYYFVYTATNAGALGEFQQSGSAYYFEPAASASVPKGGTGQFTWLTKPTMVNARLRLNALDQSSTAAGTLGATQYNTIGDTDSLYQSNGGFAEVIFFNRVLPDGEVAMIEKYLKTRWGTP